MKAGYILCYALPVKGVDGFGEGLALQKLVNWKSLNYTNLPPKREKD